MKGITILQGDVRAVLKTLPDESVHCVVTSPPYWGLRDYGCEGQIGLEVTPAGYITEMVAVFAEVKRVLRADGTLWLNMGDCYATGAGSGRSMGGDCFGKQNQVIDAASYPECQPNRMPLEGLKAKDLVGMPWRLAFALQADGWYLRSDIIWHKPNPMPESVTDRPTKSHEYIFLLSKSERYFYNAVAIREASSGPAAALRNKWDTKDYEVPGQTPQKRISRAKVPGGWDRGEGAHGTIHRDGRTSAEYQDVEVSDSRNKRTVWTVATQPMPEAHFATFPEELIKACILAGCPAGGTVLDPFGGSGTTALVARANGCKAILIELNPDYIKIAERRLAQEHLEFAL